MTKAGKKRGMRMRMRALFLTCARVSAPTRHAQGLNMHKLDAVDALARRIAAYAHKTHTFAFFVPIM
jgi:hypothetical protein